VDTQETQCYTNEVDPDSKTSVESDLNLAEPHVLFGKHSHVDIANPTYL
jgi:hypothetical protein